MKVKVKCLKMNFNKIKLFLNYKFLYKLFIYNIISIKNKIDF